jgi:hypothetical protein
MLHAKGVRDVVLDRHVREQRVALEDGVGVATERRQVVDVDARDANASRVRPHEPADDPHRRRLAAAARAQDREELARRDLEREVGDGLEVAVAHGDGLERDGSFGARLARVHGGCHGGKYGRWHSRIRYDIVGALVPHSDKYVSSL